MSRLTSKKQDGVWIDRDRVRDLLVAELGTHGFDHVQSKFPASDKVLKKLLGILPGRVRAGYAEGFARFLGVELRAITLQEDPRSLVERIRTRHWPLCENAWYGNEASIRQARLWLDLMVEDALLAGTRLMEFDDLKDVLTVGQMAGWLRGILQTFDHPDLRLIDRLGKLVHSALGPLWVAWGEDHPDIRAMLGDFWHNDPTNHPHWSRPDSRIEAGSDLVDRWKQSFSKSLRDFERSAEASPSGSPERSKYLASANNQLRCLVRTALQGGETDEARRLMDRAMDAQLPDGDRGALDRAKLLIWGSFVDCRLGDTGPQISKRRGRAIDKMSEAYDLARSVYRDEHHIPAAIAMRLHSFGSKVADLDYALMSLANSSIRCSSILDLEVVRQQFDSELGWRERRGFHPSRRSKAK